MNRTHIAGKKQGGHSKWGGWGGGGREGSGLKKRKGDDRQIRR